MTRTVVRALVLIVAACMVVAPASAQRGRGGQRGAPAEAADARATAPVDLTGTWISVVTEDWRYRMVTPAKGDHPSVPLNPAGVRVADAWDPAKDEAAGEQCRAYGAAGVMRLPGRIRLAWEDDNTLKVETEAGTQMRRFRFDAAAPQPAAPTWQGQSTAQWEYAGPGRGRGRGRGNARGGDLKVVTTHMRPGYLQKNGVPYSANATLTEYFNRTLEPNGDSWLILTAIVDDAQYLNGPFVRSTHFKRVADGDSTWEPEACSAR